MRYIPGMNENDIERFVCFHCMRFFTESYGVFAHDCGSIKQKPDVYQISSGDIKHDAGN